MFFFFKKYSILAKKRKKKDFKTTANPYSIWKQSLLNKCIIQDKSLPGNSWLKIGHWGVGVEGTTCVSVIGLHPIKTKSLLYFSYQICIHCPVIFGHLINKNEFKALVHYTQLTPLHPT